LYLLLNLLNFTAKIPRLDRSDDILIGADKLIKIFVSTKKKSNNVHEEVYI